MVEVFNRQFWIDIVTAERTAFQRYAFAFYLAILSLTLTYLIWKLEGGTPVTSLALLSVVLTAVFAGKGPAFLDTIISATGVDYFFSSPYFTIFGSTSSFIRIFVYLLTGLLVSSLVAYLKESLVLMREQNEQLKFEKSARENVLGIVSHDLRSPLSTIIMNADLLLRNLKSGKEVNLTKVSQNIKKSGLRMNNLIEDLLDSVKIERGQFKIELERHNILEIVQEAIEESLSSASAKCINLKDEGSTGNVFIRCDEKRIVQVLNNLIGNAVKFSQEGSEVVVSIDVLDGNVLVSVRDSGPGILQEDQAHLFERFWQGSETSHIGTGLGLYISKKIIASHGGDILVSSSFGEGSNFTVVMPLNDELRNEDMLNDQNKLESHIH